MRVGFHANQPFSENFMHMLLSKSTGRRRKYARSNKLAFLQTCRYCVFHLLASHFRRTF
jgi:hypothetical protein